MASDYDIRHSSLPCSMKNKHVLFSNADKFAIVLVPCQELQQPLPFNINNTNTNETFINWPISNFLSSPCPTKVEFMAKHGCDRPGNTYYNKFVL